MRISPTESVGTNRCQVITEDILQVKQSKKITSVQSTKRITQSFRVSIKLSQSSISLRERYSLLLTSLWMPGVADIKDTSRNILRTYKDKLPCAKMTLASILPTVPLT